MVGVVGGECTGVPGRGWRGTGARADAAQLRHANENLERHISLQINPALAELARKDREIARLQGAAGT